MTQRFATILIVDDELDMAESVSLVLRAAGYRTVVETESVRALGHLDDARPDLVVTDLNMPGVSGLQLLEMVHAKHPSLPVMVLTGYASIESAVDAMKLGAIDYLAKPFSNDELVVRVEKILEMARLEEENRVLREQVEGQEDARQIIGSTPEMQSILHLIHKVAATDARVLLIGESGTGKELIARTLHRTSPRARGPFFGVNCGALNENLLESELFGHERGAFTGAISTKRGIFETARGGTLFLDEVSETSGSFQTKLLRVVQEGEFMRVGGTSTIKTDVRLIASSNRDPRQCVAEGRLREDLYYRLSVVQVRLPALRERVADIPALADHFLRLYAAQIKKRVSRIDADALQALTQYAWPGNIRELENVIERAVIMVENSDAIRLEDLPFDLVHAAPAVVTLAAPEPGDELREAERTLLLRTLRECNWNRSLAAKRLGIGRRTLYDKLDRLGISLHPTV